MSLTYCQPHTLFEALSLLRKPDAVPYAGGTDLLLKLRRDPETAACLVDIKNVPELTLMERDNTGMISIGAAATMTELTQSNLVRSYLPALAQAAEVMGCREIQNRATLGGNLANASPSAETAIALMIYNAQVHLVSLSGMRSVVLADFLVAPGKTVLAPGELIAKVVIAPADVDGAQSRYLRAGRIRGMDLATVGIAVWFSPVGGERFRIAAGAVFPVVTRMTGLETYLNNQGTIADDKLAHARTLFAQAIQPRIHSLRGSPAEKRHIGGALLVRALREVIAAAEPEGGETDGPNPDHGND